MHNEWLSYDTLENMKTTLAPELFFSFIIHGIVLYFFLTLPISSVGTMSFDAMAVTLVSQEDNNEENRLQTEVANETLRKQTEQKKPETEPQDKSVGIYISRNLQTADKERVDHSSSKSSRPGEGIEILAKTKPQQILTKKAPPAPLRHDSNKISGADVIKKVQANVVKQDSAKARSSSSDTTNNIDKTDVGAIFDETETTISKRVSDDEEATEVASIEKEHIESTEAAEKETLKSAPIAGTSAVSESPHPPGLRKELQGLNRPVTTTKKITSEPSSFKEESSVSSSEVDDNKEPIATPQADNKGKANLPRGGRNTPQNEPVKIEERVINTNKPMDSPSSVEPVMNQLEEDRILPPIVEPPKSPVLPEIIQVEEKVIVTENTATSIEQMSDGNLKIRKRRKPGFSFESKPSSSEGKIVAKIEPSLLPSGTIEHKPTAINSPDPMSEQTAMEEQRKSAPRSPQIYEKEGHDDNRLSSKEMSAASSTKTQLVNTPSVEKKGLMQDEANKDVTIEETSASRDMSSVTPDEKLEMSKYISDIRISSIPPPFVPMVDNMELTAQKVALVLKNQNVPREVPRVSRISLPPPVLLGEEIIYKGMAGLVTSSELSAISEVRGAKSTMIPAIAKEDMGDQETVLADLNVQSEPAERSIEHEKDEPQVDTSVTGISAGVTDVHDELLAESEKRDLPEVVSKDAYKPQKSERASDEQEATSESAADVGLTEVFDSMFAVIDDLMEEPQVVMGIDTVDKQEKETQAEMAETRTAVISLPEKAKYEESGLEEVSQTEKEEEEGIVENILTPETSETKYNNSVVASILTPELNRTPSRRAYQLDIDSKLTLARNEVKEQEKIVKDRGLVLPLEILNDIEAEVYVQDAGDAINFALERRRHPMEDGPHRSEGEAIDLQFTERYGETGNERFLIYVERADKGVYTLKIRNNSAGVLSLSISFRLYRSRDAEKQYDFQGLALKAQEEVSIKFLIPEAIFWDEKGYFTGAIENSGSITKFNADTGLVWKEKRGY